MSEGPLEEILEVEVTINMPREGDPTSLVEMGPWESIICLVENSYVTEDSTLFTRMIFIKNKLYAYC